MAQTLKKIFDPGVDEVVQDYTIESWHISQSIDALTGADAYDITLSGSLVVTGSVAVNGLTQTTQNSVVTIDTTTGQLFYTSSTALASNNYYTSSVTNSYTSSTVTNNFSTSSVINNYTSSTVYTNNIAPSDQYIQYNSASAFGASIGFQYIYSSQSFQQGLNAIASGGYSHAQGKSTRATGNTSHAEGNLSLSSGEFSHAEGLLATSSGAYSHAEGNSTISSGIYSHAEGNSTRATATASHAEGTSTQATGNNSHAEGGASVASGVYSHAEGFQTLASGIGAHAEGQNTTSLGQYSHTEGLYTVASGAYQHAQGQYNKHGDSTSLVIVGNGTSDVARKDAFKVRMSGSIVLPTTQSTAPSWTGTDGEIIPATVSGKYLLYMWMNGAWRSGSFV